MPGGPGLGSMPGGPLGSMSGGPLGSMPGGPLGSPFSSSAINIGRIEWLESSSVLVTNITPPVLIECLECAPL